MTDRLAIGEKLDRGQSLTSRNGAYTLTLQDDGNLVLAAQGQAEARLAEWTAEPDLDAALDFYNDLMAHVQGKLRSADTAAELNAGPDIEHPDAYAHVC